MSNIRLIFEMSPRISQHLMMGELRLVEGNVVQRWRATSGTIRNQTQKSFWTRGKGLLPPSNAVRKPYAVLTALAFSDNFSATGGHIHGIWPNNVWSTDGTKVRKGLAIHFDANHATSPGSGGCIVFTLPLEWEHFAVEMRRLCNAGVKEIPLEVSYS